VRNPRGRGNVLERECPNRTERIISFWAIQEEFTSGSTCKQNLGTNLIVPKIVSGKNYAF
jgi:hypothetical protein